MKENKNKSDNAVLFLLLPCLVVIILISFVYLAEKESEATKQLAIKEGYVQKYDPKSNSLIWVKP